MTTAELQKGNGLPPPSPAFLLDVFEQFAKTRKWIITEKFREEIGCDDGEEVLGTPVSTLLAREIPEPAWLIFPHLQEKAVALLAGPPGAGKTLLAIDWCAQCVASGKKVFIAENEGGERALQERLRRACWAAGLVELPEHFRYVRNYGLPIAEVHRAREFGKSLEGYDLILLDSLGSFWPGMNENDPEHMSLAAEGLKLICESSGATTIGIGHTVKTAWKPGEKPSLGDIRGHGSMHGRIDQAFIAIPEEEAKAGVVRLTLHTVKQRDTEMASPRAMEITMTGDAATVTSTEQPWEKSKPQSAASVRIQKMMEVVLKAVPDDDAQAMSTNQIVDKLRKHKQTVSAAIKQLVIDEKLGQLGDGRVYRMKGDNPRDSGSLDRYSHFSEKTSRTSGDEV